MLTFLLQTTVFGQADDRIVVAQYGEGIYTILRRMDMEPEFYVEAFIQLNREKLRSDSLLIAGNTYILPEEIITKAKPPITEIPAKIEAIPAGAHDESAVKTKIYPIFGKAQETVLIKNDKLSGAIFYLVSGHGGPDPGALGQYGKYTLSEDEYAYDVTLRLARNLISSGANVYIIIQDPNDGIRDDPVLLLDKDEQAYTSERIPVNQKERLKQRTDVINKLYKENKSPYQRLITIHVDSRSTGENIDVFFYYHHRSKSGRQLAGAIQQTFNEKYARHQPGRSYHGTVSSRSNLYMIKNTLAPTVYIELGNIKNTRDQRRLVISDNRQALANWIMEGIIKDHQAFEK